MQHSAHRAVIDQIDWQITCQGQQDSNKPKDAIETDQAGTKSAEDLDYEKAKEDKYHRTRVCAALHKKPF